MPDETRPPRDVPGAHRLAHALGADDPLPIDPDLAPDDTAEPSRTHRAGAGGHRVRPVILGAILVGGFLGTLGRYEVGVSWPTRSGHFPTGTFVVNSTGAFALGLVLTVLLERVRHPGAVHVVRPFVATGLLGGWTTYSTLALGADTLGKSGDVATAAGYLALTLVCGITAVAAGIALGRSRALGTGPVAGTGEVHLVVEGSEAES